MEGCLLEASPFAYKHFPFFQFPFPFLLFIRCFVLPDNEDDNSDIITVFFVDYGNMASVKFQDFRHTYSTFWKLPPQAIPCKIHGSFFFSLSSNFPVIVLPATIKGIYCVSFT